MRAGRSLTSPSRFIEKREHGGMTAHVVSADECGTPTRWSQRGKIVRLPVVMGELIGRRH